MRNYSRVIYALILHDIKSRFFGNGWGQVLLILWPFVHMVFLVGAYTVSGRTVPFGSSLLLFACTGAIPWIVFSYMSRWIAFSPSSNRSLLNYPIVMPLDLVFSRALLEIAVNAIVVALALVVLVMMGTHGLTMLPKPLARSQLAFCLPFQSAFLTLPSFSCSTFGRASTFSS
jgi:capsular polysaccharide transport system permease protein